MDKYYNAETDNTEPSTNSSPEQSPSEPGSNNSMGGPTAHSSADLTPGMLNTPPAPGGRTFGSKSKLILMTIAAIVLLALVASVSFYLGRSHEKVVIKEPVPQPVNLPPQATVLAACVPGRGKQYILPKDIPVGPIYDVYNTKVIAVEYNLNLGQLFENSAPFSDAILSAIKNYNVTHFSFVPVLSGSSASQTQSNPKASSAASQEQAASQLSNISSVHLVVYLVPTTITDKITCSSSATH